MQRWKKKWKQLKQWLIVTEEFGLLKIVYVQLCPIQWSKLISVWLYRLNTAFHSFFFIQPSTLSIHPAISMTISSNPYIIACYLLVYVPLFFLPLFLSVSESITTIYLIIKIISFGQIQDLNCFSSVLTTNWSQNYTIQCYKLTIP